MARVALGMSVHAVKDATGLGSTTITRVELSKGRHLTDTIDALRDFYEREGVEFSAGGWVRHAEDAEASQAEQPQRGPR